MHIGAKLTVLPLFCLTLPAMAQERDATVIEHELTTTITLPAPQIQSLQCQAELAISYLQKNTIADVEGTLENNDCAASSGSYVLSVRTTDANGMMTTQEFPQTWAREDDQDVTFRYEFEIGENVELTRVRAQKVQCRCKAPE